LTARVRAPDATEQLRSHAAKVLAGTQLEAFVNAANPAAFSNSNGEIDEEKVMGHLTAIFATNQPRQWGQHSGNPPGSSPGDNARSALQRRQGVKQDSDTPHSSSPSGRGARGRAALAARHGKAGN
jgi:hypothetical protein